MSFEMANESYAVGIDIGSTTVKVIDMDAQDHIVYANIRGIMPILKDGFSDAERVLSGKRRCTLYDRGNRKRGVKPCKADSD